MCVKSMNENINNKAIKTLIGNGKKNISLGWIGG